MRRRARRTVGTSGALASAFSLSREKTEREREKAGGRVEGELKAGVVALGDRDGVEGGKEKDDEIETMTKDKVREYERAREFGDKR